MNLIETEKILINYLVNYYLSFKPDKFNKFNVITVFTNHFINIQPKLFYGNQIFQFIN